MIYYKQEKNSFKEVNMDILRKTVALCLIFSMLAIAAACSSGTADSSSNSG